MFAHSEISNFLEKENYAQLIELVIKSSEYTTKDRKDIFKYLKRVQAFSKVGKLLESQFLCTLGDRDAINNFVKNELKHLSNSDQSQIYNVLLECYSYKELQDILPEELYEQRDFFSKILDGFDSSSEEFQKFIISKVNVDKFNFELIINRKNLWKYLVPMFDEAQKDSSKYLQLKQKLAAKIGGHTNCRESEIILLSKYYSLSEIFNKDTLKFYFTGIYRWGNPSKEKCEIITQILKTGFRDGLTSLLTQAVRNNDMEMVKILLPYKPRLEKALELKVSEEMYYVLSVANQAREKKKVNKSVAEPVDQ